MFTVYYYYKKLVLLVHNSLLISNEYDQLDLFCVRSGLLRKADCCCGLWTIVCGLQSKFPDPSLQLTLRILILQYCYTTAPYRPFIVFTHFSAKSTVFQLFIFRLKVLQANRYAPKLYTKLYIKLIVHTRPIFLYLAYVVFVAYNLIISYNLVTPIVGSGNAQS